MQYPEEFKQKVLSIYGEDEDIREMLETGNEFLGRCLDQDSCRGVSAQEIIEACESMNLQGIYQEAKKQVALAELYSEWCDLRKNEMRNQGMHK